MRKTCKNGKTDSIFHEVDHLYRVVFGIDFLNHLFNQAFLIDNKGKA
jgi:hypothetical protein